MSPEPGYEYGVCDYAGLPLLEQTLKHFPKLKILGHSQLFWLEISSDCPKEGNQNCTAMGRGPIQPGADTVNKQQTFPFGVYIDKAYMEGRLREVTYKNICYQNAKRIFNM